MRQKNHTRFVKRAGFVKGRREEGKESVVRIFVLFVLVCFLLAAPAGQAQRKGSKAKPGVSRAELAKRDGEADQAWHAFYTRFREAVRMRDRAALREMMSPDDFLYTFGDSDNRDQALDYWDDQAKHGMAPYADLERILGKGIVRIPARMNAYGLPSRDAPPAAIKMSYMGLRTSFVFINGRWLWVLYIGGD
jgi:hypothetical protein